MAIAMRLCRLSQPGPIFAGVMFKNPLVATHEFAYAGKDVLVLVVRLISGDWVWSFEYDGGHPHINDAERYPSSLEAIEGGIRAARFAIDAGPAPMLH